MDLNSIYLGDNVEVLKTFPDECIDCTITSPPYFQLREYNGCGMGNEETVDQYLDNLMSVMDELYRVTKPKGTIVINLGDKYDNGNLMLLPYRFAIKAQDRFGKKLRLINDLTWVKPNPTPRQDKTKLIQATEPFFIFAKEANYNFDKTKFLTAPFFNTQKERKKAAVSEAYGRKYREQIDAAIELTELEKANAHAALDAAIADVKAGVITGIRMKIRGIHALAYGGQEGGRNNAIHRDGYTIIRLFDEPMKRDIVEFPVEENLTEMNPAATMKSDIIEYPVESIKGNKHPAVYPTALIEEIIKLLTDDNAIVMDCFSGSGTTAVASFNVGRRYVGVEIDPEYHQYSLDRLAALQPEISLPEPQAFAFFADSL